MSRRFFGVPHPPGSPDDDRPAPAAGCAVRLSLLGWAQAGFRAAFVRARSTRCRRRSDRRLGPRAAPEPARPRLAARSTGSEDGGLRDVGTIRAGRESSEESPDFGLDNGVHLKAQEQDHAASMEYRDEGRQDEPIITAAPKAGDPSRAFAGRSEDPSRTLQAQLSFDFIERNRCFLLGP
jgi:hypothetical protein